MLALKTSKMRRTCFFFKVICFVMCISFFTSVYFMLSQIQIIDPTFELQKAKRYRDQIRDAAVIAKYWKLTNAPTIPKLLKKRINNIRLNITEDRIHLPVNNLWETDGSYNDRILEQLNWIMEVAKQPSVLQNLTMKKIMLVNTFRWWHFRSNTEFRYQCPGIGEKCEFVDLDEDRTASRGTRITKAKVDSLITVSDIFHWGDINMDPDVLRFFYILESNYHADATLQRRTDILSSYLRASNLVAPYGKWVYYDPNVKGQMQYKDHASSKRKIVAVTMSECNALNDRMKYIKELQKYIQVDIYGNCGNLTCPRSNCMNKLRMEYKFYLAFENSNCRDYITEKFYRNSLRNDIVPVVMGAHPDDYKAVAPHHSYIHVEDFEKPADLANYLMYLHKNDTAYNEYFRWKGTGEFIDTKFLCRVCAMTHYAEYVPPPVRTDAFQWEDLAKNKLCLPISELYWKWAGNSTKSFEHANEFRETSR